MMPRVCVWGGAKRWESEVDNMQEGDIMGLNGGYVCMGIECIGWMGMEVIK